MFRPFNIQGVNVDNRFETLQNARRDLIGEIEAIIQYDQHYAESTNEVAKSTWASIRNEELTHVGELLALLDFLEPSQKAYVESGMREFAENNSRK